MKSIQIEDDGRLEINGVTVDVALAAEMLSRAVKEADGDEMVYSETLKNAMASLGFPVMSHIANHKVACAIWDENKALQKKDEATPAPDDVPGSPTTTV